MKAEVLRQGPRNIARFIGSRLTGGGFAELAEIATTDHYEPPKAIESFNFALVAELEDQPDKTGVYDYLVSRVYRINRLQNPELDSWREDFAGEIEWADHTVNNNFLPYSAGKIGSLKHSSLAAERIMHPDEAYAQTTAIDATPSNRR